jgi:hypothetical protein
MNDIALSSRRLMGTGITSLCIGRLNNRDIVYVCNIRSVSSTRARVI